MQVIEADRPYYSFPTDDWTHRTPVPSTKLSGIPACIAIGDHALFAWISPQNRICTTWGVMDNVDAREGVWDFAGPNTDVWPDEYRQTNNGPSRLSFVTDGEFVFLVYRDQANHVNFVEVKKTTTDTGRVAYRPGNVHHFRDQSTDPISINILGNATYNRGFFYIIYTIVDDSHIFFNSRRYAVYG